MNVTSMNGIGRGEGAARTRSVCSRFVGLVLALASLAIVGVASAAGGSSIASAPAVTFGQPQFGNTSCCADPAASQKHSEWWRLPLIAGDRVTIDIAYDASGQGALTSVQAFPPDTTDFNVAQAKPVASESVDFAFQRLPAKSEIKFSANQSGYWPLEFFTQTDGGFTTTPYQFTAYVKHAIVLAAKATIGRGRGSVLVSAHTPDGKPVADGAVRIRLLARVASTWRQLTQRTAVAGRAVLKFSTPAALRGKTTSLRIAASGNGYQPAARVLRVRFPR